MGEIAYLNGQWMKPSEAKVSAEDRGFVFGDGVYEAAVTYDGRIWALERHLARLVRSLREIRIEGVDIDAIGAAMREGLKRSGFASAVVYLQVTRGAAPRKHAWKPGLVPTVFMTVREFTPYDAKLYERGVAVITVPEVRWGRCDIKSLNLLPNVMAYQKATEAGAWEAIFVCPDGTVTECSHSALFIVQGGVAVTRETGPHILPSITQGLVLETASDLGIPAKQRRFTKGEMTSADEVFIAGTTPGMMPVTRIDGARIADGKPGPVTKRLLEGYWDRVKRRDDAPR